MATSGERPNRPKADCPVCRGADSIDTVQRAELPAMQNYVYRTRDEALSAPRGPFVLAACRSCGFAWNRVFDPDLLVYDEGYDNAVPSTVMRAYYEEIADYLADRNALEDGLVVDVGCGDGAFLRTLCGPRPSIRGLGVDPALPRDSTELAGRISLVKTVFSPAQVPERPALALSRHVLEHIHRPVPFLSAVSAAKARGTFPCFFEVPDVEWIVENRTFWDFCYEHCNYFSGESFEAALVAAGITPTRTQNGFHGQYLWMEGEAGGEQGVTAIRAASSLPGRLAAYAAHEETTIEATRARLRLWRSSGTRIVVWGMATKGVLFSLLVDRGAELLDACVDVNPNKQGAFAPLTGHRIDPPEALRGLRGETVVLVMNDNYRDEVRAACNALGLDATVMGTAEAAVAA